MGLFTTTDKLESKYFKDVITFNRAVESNDVFQIERYAYQQFNINTLYIPQSSNSANQNSFGNGIYDDNKGKFIVNYQTLIDLGLATNDKLLINNETDYLLFNGDKFIIDSIVQGIKYINRSVIAYIFIQKAQKDV